MTIFTFRQGYESQEIIVCDTHALEMPLVNQDTVFSRPADHDATCEFCGRG